MTELPTKNHIKKGMKVAIELKQDQGTGKLTEGIVKDILTASSVHPHGIKVELEEGFVGRVKKLFTNIEDETIFEINESKSKDDVITTSQYERDDPEHDEYETELDIIINEKLPSHKSSNIDTSILKNEDEYNEFKSTYRLDLKRFEQGDGKKTQSPGVEKEIAVTISAMANKKGGILFIGVDDNGEVLGLENDYDLLGNPNDDKFQNMIWQTIKNFIKEMAYVSDLDMSLINKESKKICIIKIHPADEPIFVRDNNIDESYVRMGSRSEKLNTSDFIKYCKTRFKE